MKDSKLIQEHESVKELVLDIYDEVCEVYPKYEMKEPNLDNYSLQRLMYLYCTYYNMLP